MYGTGFGVTNPPQPSGQLINAAPVSNSVSATVCGQPATVSFAGLASPGLDQINVTMPTLPAGNCPLQVTVAGLNTQAGVIIPIGQ